MLLLQLLRRHQALDLRTPLLVEGPHHRLLQVGMLRKVSLLYQVSQLHRARQLRQVGLLYLECPPRQVSLAHQAILEL